MIGLERKAARRAGLGRLGPALAIFCLVAGRLTAQTPPESHTENKSGVWHAPGSSAPFDNGCTDCHGSHLGGGTAGSCFTCHYDYSLSGGNARPKDWTIPDFNPDPTTHTRQKHGYWHAWWERKPFTSHCTDCHGPSLYGGLGPACYQCHRQKWDGNDAVNLAPPLDHTIAKNGALHKPGYGTPYVPYPEPTDHACSDCHGPHLNDGFAPSCYTCHDRYWAGEGPPPDHTELKGGFAWHKPGASDPYTNGCTQCHGPNLDDGFAPSCFSCHGPGGGRPTDHTEVLGGYAAHKPGYEDPYASGCTQCHGPNLNDGYAPSCFSCHGARWDPHDFSAEPWLPAGENHCHVCHLPPGFGERGPHWNHALSTSTYTVTTTTIAQVGQPDRTSDKCMDCHEGPPDGPAVDDYGGNTGGTYFVDGEEAFGTDLTVHHPVSFTFDSALAALHGGVHDPATRRSGLTWSGTIAQDMLDENGKLQCTSCHNQHDNSRGDYLYMTMGEGLCFVCHVFEAPVGRHHIPGRQTPWASFRCTLCHGPNLGGAAEGGMGPACTDCHNSFAAPEPPPPGHHGGDRFLPYFDCAACHADPITGVVTGSHFGTVWAPSCYQCHGDFWNDGTNDPPSPVTMGDVSGTVGEPVVLDASHIADPEGDPIAYAWSFGDGSPSPFPSHEATTTHTYGDYGTYTAVLSVTDGVNPPQFAEFQVHISPGAAEPVADEWTVTTSEPETFTVTLEEHSGSLVVIKDDGDPGTADTLGYGVEFAGVIFWLELWMDLSDNVFWGTGDIYFGNIDREAGTMSGVVFDQAGGVFAFSGTRN